MNICVTIGHPHQGTKDAKAKVIVGPEVPAEEHIALFKKACASRVHKEFGTIEVISSTSGLTRRNKFISPDEEERRKKAQEKAEAESKKQAEKVSKLADAEAESEAKRHKESLKAKADAKAKAGITQIKG